MPASGKITTVGLLLLFGWSGAASASVDRMARLKSQCLSTKEVLRVNTGAKLADLKRGGKMKLVSFKVCTAERRACFAQGDEVPMSRCAPQG